MAATLGEMALEITPELNQAKTKNIFKKIQDGFKDAFKQPEKFFAKGGTLATGLNQSMEIIKKIGELIEEQRNMVDEISGRAGSISDFAQSVGLEGQEAKLQYVITQLAAGGLGGETSMKMLEEFQKKVASGEVDIGGMDLLDAYTSALADVARFAPGSAEYLQRYKKLFNEEVKITGDIASAIKAYETRDVGDIGTRAGFEDFQKSLFGADWAESEKEFERQKGFVAQANAVMRRGGFEAIVEAEKVQQKQELVAAEQVSREAIIGGVKVMGEIRNIMTRVGGQLAEIAGDMMDRLDAIIKIMSGEGKAGDWAKAFGLSEKRKKRVEEFFAEEEL